MACLAFLFATAYAIAVVVFRLPIDGLLEPRLFRMALALHVELAVYFWLMSTAAAEWSAGDARDDLTPLPARYLPPALAALGTLSIALSPWLGGEPRMADYFPWLDGNLLFRLGFSSFTVAVLLAATRAARLAVCGGESAIWRGVGISALPVLAAAATALVDLLQGARSIADLAWGAGHTLLFSHVALMCWEWSRLGNVAVQRSPRAAIWLLAAAAMLLPLTGFVFAPGSVEHQRVFTLAMSWLLWPPALLVGLTALHATPSHDIAVFLNTPADRGLRPRLVIALTLSFFVCGNVLGALIDGATTLVTAHYHATIGAVALSRMAMTYFSADRLAPALPSPRGARRQFLTYATALVLLASGLALGAIDASPRKTSAGELASKGPYFRAGMSISGVGGLFAIAGSLWLVFNLTLSGRGRGSASTGNDAPALYRSPEPAPPENEPAR